MAVRMRLRRIGKKKQPIYRVVVAESACPRDGRFIETVGHYNPGNSTITFKEEKALYWLSNGARPTETVRSLLRKKGIWDKFQEARKPNNKEVGTVEAVVGNAG
ncbi:MAG TPA: 30S ribosomal protein S16 [Candidatus Eremiobacteraeota bacterium]|nr:MAG: 30S ribosomal protein S16 [bacterium ADurb.Bin363]HPZ07447.1 30S ribosomal protein S16 [Candidatus Eremiobacteraeota bacterium]